MSKEDKLMDEIENIIRWELDEMLSELDEATRYPNYNYESLQKNIRQLKKFINILGKDIAELKKIES